MLLAALGVITPVAGLHKFYLGRPAWGVAYLLLIVTPIPHIASAIEAVWYLVQDNESFNRRFNAEAVTIPSPPADDGTAERVVALATALRELDCLRQDGLLSEYEFEQKRRQLIERLG
ncbi:MAG: NINE protein [Spirulinaceae cyanobacterium RM2_2_10]|nr:NINE protein [Spirulinaceae cyanobacterium RM2_2_10]